MDIKIELSVNHVPSLGKGYPRSTSQINYNLDFGLN